MVRKRPPPPSRVQRVSARTSLLAKTNKLPVEAKHHGMAISFFSPLTSLCQFSPEKSMLQPAPLFFTLFCGHQLFFWPSLPWESLLYQSVGSPSL